MSQITIPAPDHLVVEWSWLRGQAEAPVVYDEHEEIEYRLTEVKVIFDPKSRRLFSVDAKGLPVYNPRKRTWDSSVSLLPDVAQAFFDMAYKVIS